jgi:hypothetical protein
MICTTIRLIQGALSQISVQLRRQRGELSELEDTPSLGVQRPPRPRNTCDRR